MTETIRGIQMESKSINGAAWKLFREMAGNIVNGSKSSDQVSSTESH